MFAGFLHGGGRRLFPGFRTRAHQFNDFVDVLGHVEPPFYAVTGSTVHGPSLVWQGACRSARNGGKQEGRTNSCWRHASSGVRGRDLRQPVRASLAALDIRASRDRIDRLLSFRTPGFFLLPVFGSSIIRRLLPNQRDNACETLTSGVTSPFGRLSKRRLLVNIKNLAIRWSRFCWSQWQEQTTSIW